MAKHISTLLHTTFFAVLTLSMSHQAAADPNRADKSLAAGYKAMFTCSATFNGAKTLEQIEQDELSNIYSDYKEAMVAVEDPVINQVEKYVAVQFAEDMPPRISAWRPLSGCTALPPGATVKDIKYLPKVKLKSPKTDAEDIMWPMGDKLPNSSSLNGAVADKIDDLVAAAFVGEYGGNTSAVLIVKDRQIISERYKEGLSLIHI